MQKTILFAVALLLCGPLLSQNTFHKKGTNGYFFSSTVLKDGGLLCVGSQDQPYFGDRPQGLLVQFDPTGEVIWRKRLPAPNFIRYALETDYGFLVVGDSTGMAWPSPDPRYTIVSALTSEGNVIWSSVLGSPTEQIIPGKMLKTSDGSVIAVSSNQLIRLGDSGNTLWSKRYLVSNNNILEQIVPQFIEGDTLFACGRVQGNGAFIRISLSTGLPISIASFGGIYFEDLTSLQPTQDHNFIVSGLTRSTTGSEESRPWVVKVNRLGQIIWSKTYNLLGTSLVSEMTGTPDGGIVLSIRGDNSSSTTFGILTKIDASGNALWAYNYSSGQEFGFRDIQLAADGGFVITGHESVLKTDQFGRVSNGCCPAPILFQVEDYAPNVQNRELSAENGASASLISLQSELDDRFSISDYCAAPISTIVEQIQLCLGDSIQINGNFYQAPNIIRDTILSFTGGCDTVRVYNLLQIPQPFRVETIAFCPGTSVQVNGITYTQPDTISQIIPATVGCDTLLVTFLKLNPLPKKYETTTFCPGDTVFIGGIAYLYPGVLPNPDTLPGLECDTLLFQVLAYPSVASAVSIQCPPNIEVSTKPGLPLVVQYNQPTATTDCTCPDLYLIRTLGFSSGASFPVGLTTVCYEASDICGAFQTCCFEVNVIEEEACDVKETSCIRYELLGISIDASQQKTYRLRVTNTCASPLVYTAFQVPEGVEADFPLQNSVYVTPNGNAYRVRNPNQAPFRSVRFKALGSGISSGESDVFEYTLPAQSSPNFLKATTRLASGNFYEVLLNTFACSIQAERPEHRAPKANAQSNLGLRVYPNPSAGELFIDFSSLENVSTQLRLLNAQGQELAQRTMVALGGVQAYALPDDLPDGLYFLEILPDGAESTIAKFVLKR